jgi:hypothetical protein
MPIGFFSMKFGVSEWNYSTYDKELLGLFRALELFATSSRTPPHPSASTLTIATLSTSLRNAC